MSRSYRELMETRYWLAGLLLDGDRRQAEQGMREWYEDQAGQAEYASWLDSIEQPKE